MDITKSSKNCEKNLNFLLTTRFKSDRIVTSIKQIDKETEKMTKFELLVELDRMLMGRLGREERYIQKHCDNQWSEYQDGYVDGLEYAMACISDMKEEV